MPPAWPMSDTPSDRFRFATLERAKQHVFKSYASEGIEERETALTDKVITEDSNMTERWGIKSMVWQVLNWLLDDSVLLASFCT